MSFSGADLVDRINKTIKLKKLKKEPAFYEIVPSGTFSAWKNKGQIPMVDTVCDIAENLGVTLDYLVLGKKTVYVDEGEYKLLEVYNKLNDAGKKAALGSVGGLISFFPQSSEQAGESTGTAT